MVQIGSGEEGRRYPVVADLIIIISTIINIIIIITTIIIITNIIIIIIITIIRYPVVAGMEAWRSLLNSQFPGEAEAIDKYFSMMSATKASTTIQFALKLAPLWLVRLVLLSGILRLVTNIYRPEYKQSALRLAGY